MLSLKVRVMVALTGTLVAPLTGVTCNELTPSVVKEEVKSPKIVLPAVSVGAVTDTAGNTIFGDFTSSFTTEGVSSLQVTPVNGATNVPVNATITLTFNDNIKPGPSYANITIPWSSPLTKTINGITL